jgi:transposase
MSLDKRAFNCPDCGISIDRELNASLNIRNIGFNTDWQSGIYACGDGSIEPSLKQEKECLVN